MSDKNDKEWCGEHSYFSPLLNRKRKEKREKRKEKEKEKVRRTQ